MITKYYCDSCHGEINGKFARITVESGIILENDNEERNPIIANDVPVRYADICLNCFNKLPLSDINAHKRHFRSLDLDD